MTIQVVSDKTESYEHLGQTYRWVHMRCDSHEAIVGVVTGKYPRIQVKVLNAMAKAWRTGAAREFLSIEAAQAAYKTSAIKAMIGFVAA